VSTRTQTTSGPLGTRARGVDTVVSTSVYKTSTTTPSSVYRGGEKPTTPAQEPPTPRKTPQSGCLQSTKRPGTALEACWTRRQRCRLWRVQPPTSTGGSLQRSKTAAPTPAPTCLVPLDFCWMLEQEALHGEQTDKQRPSLCTSLPATLHVIIYTGIP